jgi:hypothetical protein
MMLAGRKQRMENNCVLLVGSAWHEKHATNVLHLFFFE